MGLIEVNTNPSRRELLWFGLILAVFGLVVGAVVWWQFGAATVAKTIWAVAAVVAVVYYAIPLLRKPLYVGWLYAAFPIGWVVSHVLLAAIYYLVFTPIGLAMRLIGRDPLQKRRDSAAKSYWMAHNPGGNPGRYFRQF